MTNTAYKLPPTGIKRKWFDPCLVMRPTAGSTMGRVVNWLEGDPFDDLMIEFRGKTLKAKAAHPEIRLGQLVNVFEWPEGMFWGTCLQPSWYLQSVEDLVKNRRPSQAAMNHLMRKNPKYWPALIRIDKRGQPQEDDDLGADDGSKVGSDGWNDWDGDGFMNPDEWATAGHNSADFAAADANGDGKISPEEYAAWLSQQGDAWFQQAYPFPFDPALYNNSWFAYVEFGTESLHQSTAPFILQSSNGVRKSNYNSTFEYGVSPLIIQPYAGHEIVYPQETTQDLGNGRSRRFYRGVIGGSNSAVLESVTFQGAGGGFEATGGGPGSPAWDIHVENKAAALASAISAASSHNADGKILVIRNNRNYAAFNLYYTVASETGTPAGFYESYVVYTASSRYVF